MNRLAMTIFAALIPVSADAGRMTVEPGDGGCFAIIYVENLVGPYNYTRELETGRGSIFVEYETVGLHNATDHDIVTVRGLPFGVAADPMRMALPDGETGEICLYEYVGA